MRACGRRPLGITEFCPKKVGAFSSNLIESSSPRRGGLRGRRKRGSGPCYRVEVMPAVGGMRRTRVFGLYKGADGARVLRSGRMLGMESSNGKLKKLDNDSEDVFPKDSNGNSRNGKDLRASAKTTENGWVHNCNPRHAPACVRNVKTEVSNPVTDNGREDKIVDGKKSFNAVYIRKRKRACSRDVKAERMDFLTEFGASDRQKVTCMEQCFAVVSDGFSSTNSLGALLTSILNYMKRVGLELSFLAAFLLSNPLSGVFASVGIHFSWDPPNRVGVCKLFGVSQRLPIFTVDFSCIPSWFTYMHFRLHFQLKNHNVPTINNSLDSDEEMTCEDSHAEAGSSSVVVIISSNNNRTASQETECSRNKVAHPSVRSSKLFGRSTQLRISLNSRGVRKRRSSLRQRRGGNHSTVQQIGQGFSMYKKTPGSYMTYRSSKVVRKPISIKPTLDSQVQGFGSSNLVCDEVGQDSPVSNSSLMKLLEESAKDMSSCAANLLVIESDRCYRVSGVYVSREVSKTGEWWLVAQKEGKTLYSNLPHQSMKPCSFNRITHDVIWSTDETCKLEFPCRLDWLIFRNLYKACSDRNVPAAVAKVIPVPGVCEVPEYEDCVGGSFTRPEWYISFQLDEVTRALAKKNAMYEMDSEDEEWLRAFNRVPLTDNVDSQLPELSTDNFELMIDAFEKAMYCSPDEFSDEKAATNLCAVMAGKDVVEPVYSYWMKKRKQKRSALLRVLQEHHPKKASLIPKPALRKKRSSFKRQPSIIGRGKQPGLFQAISTLNDALEEQNALLKLEEAKQSEKKIIEYAIDKRRRAQQLMENADLAVYKAVMALKIAEAALCSSAADLAVPQMMN